MKSREEDTKYFYELLKELSLTYGGCRTLARSGGRDNWPTRGVYFFFEDGEQRSGSGDGARVVRVGTHALKAGSGTTLWKRLSQHRGTARSGGGNHRGSIFRLLVGTSLIARDGLSCPSWDSRRSSAPKEVRAAELPTEQQVSSEMGAMPFLWLGVDDAPGPDSDRGIIERGAIALLSEFGKPALDPPSPNWLGRYCDRPKVQASGLWNNNHVDEDYDPAFLDVMASWVEKRGKAR